MRARGTSAGRTRADRMSADHRPAGAGRTRPGLPGRTARTDLLRAGRTEAAGRTGLLRAGRTARTDLLRAGQTEAAGPERRQRSRPTKERTTRRQSRSARRTAVPGLRARSRPAKERRNHYPSRSARRGRNYPQGSGSGDRSLEAPILLSDQYEKHPNRRLAHTRVGSGSRLDPDPTRFTTQ